MKRISMKRISLFALLVVFFAANAMAATIVTIPINGGERFPAVTLAKGQQERVVISNVLVPKEGKDPRACTVRVIFLDPNGVRTDTETVLVKHGASASVVRPESEPGLLRTIVTVTADESDPDKIADPDAVCAIRTTLEVFDSTTERTVLMVPAAASCIGKGKCTYGLNGYTEW